jgi:hypothetical protein
LDLAVEVHDLIRVRSIRPSGSGRLVSNGREEVALLDAGEPLDVLCLHLDKDPLRSSS